MTQISSLFSALKRSIFLESNSQAGGVATAATATGDAGGSEDDVLRRRMEMRFERAQERLFEYIKHKMRKSLQARAQVDWRASLSPDTVMIIADYKAKIEPKGHYEQKGDIMAGGGMSCRIFYCVLRLPATMDKSQVDFGPTKAVRLLEIGEEDFLVLPVRVLCDDTKQTWFHSAETMLACLCQLKRMYAHLKHVKLLTDGASNYDYGNFLYALADMHIHSGLRVLEHVIFEAGEGKSAADSDGASVQRGMQAQVKAGWNVQCARELQEALDRAAHNGESAPAVNIYVTLNTRLKVGLDAHPLLAGISLWSQRTYMENGDILVREQYGIGPGKRFTHEGLQRARKRSTFVSPEAVKVLAGGEVKAKVKGRLSDDHAQLLKERNVEKKAARKRAADEAVSNKENKPPLAGQKSLLACGQGLCTRTFTCEKRRMQHHNGKTCRGEEKQRKMSRTRYALADVTAMSFGSNAAPTEVETRAVALPAPPEWEKCVAETVKLAFDVSSKSVGAAADLFANQGWAMKPRGNKRRSPEAIEACRTWARAYHKDANANNMRANEWTASRQMKDEFPDDPEMWMEPGALKPLFAEFSKAANAAAGKDARAAQPAAVVAAQRDGGDEGWTAEELHLALMEAAVNENDTADVDGEAQAL
jgi:hypothetical protein